MAGDINEIYTENPNNREWRGSYLGFTFNGVHSSDLGIVRTSSGSRYNDDLLPTTTDKTVEVPGGDGTYYFGSYYTQRQFTIDFAFDRLTDLQLRNLRRCLGDKKIHDLIFDETPYKVYSAKVTGSSSVKHLCFDIDGGQRIFKGEGTIQFTCFFPFARSRYKYLDSYTLGNIPEWDNDADLVNTKEWRVASGIDNQGINDMIYEDAIEKLITDIDLITTAPGDLFTDDLEPNPPAIEGGYIVLTSEATELGDGSSPSTLFAELGAWFTSELGEAIGVQEASSYIELHPGILPVNEGNSTYFIIYNAGDLPTDWTLKIDGLVQGNLKYISSCVLGTYRGGGLLIIDKFFLNEGDSYVIVNSKTHMIEGYTVENVKSGNIYNAAVVLGDYFKIQTGKDRFLIIGTTEDILLHEYEIKYDYLYF